MSGIILFGLSLMLAASDCKIMKNRVINRQRGTDHRLTNDDKIVGGTFAKSIVHFPFMVSIRINDEHDCGGSLLSMTFVLTACHCVAELPLNDSGLAMQSSIHLDGYSFVAGSKTLKPLEKTAQVRKASSLHHHPKCEHIESIVYDLGLGIMEKPFVESPSVKPIKMFSWDKIKLADRFVNMSNDDEGPKCLVTGWGESRRGDQKDPKASNTLKYLRMFLLTEDDCHDAYYKMFPEIYAEFTFSDYGQVCAVSEKLDSSDCAGDSGGPYFCDGRVVGVVSYGTTCGTADPSVYQTVSALVDWFREKFSGKIDMTEPDAERPRNYLKNHTSDVDTGGSSEAYSKAALNHQQCLILISIARFAR